ncbi:hypothetical protein ACH5RR_015441 [Cinchona calisaya]|uniref:Uncharacterized protein n=1 Tax=Cinchona calisaya TaxID=153742 RepID=A0ABD2ZVV2_9GENT
MAPRVKTKDSNSENEIFSTRGYVDAEANSHRIMKMTTLLSELVEEQSAATEASILLESQSHDETEYTQDDRGTRCDMLQYSIYKPCTALHKECSSYSNPTKLRTEDIDEIVRSSYFPQKEMNHIKKKDRDAAADNYAMFPEKYKYMPASDDSGEKMNKNVIVRSSYFKSKSMKGRIQSGKSDKASVEESVAPHDKYSSGLNEIEGKSTTDEGNATQRSSYFQHSSVNKYEKLIVEDDITTDRDENATDSIFLTNNYFQEARKKRKVASNDNAITEYVRRNDLRTGAALPMESDSGAADSIAQEGKIGCNISHLRHYSEIAEKSMEKFVSVISSFKFTSNGSRASGLRAPLKDVKNTCTTGSTKKEQGVADTQKDFQIIKVSCDENFEDYLKLAATHVVDVAIMKTQAVPDFVIHFRLSAAFAPRF